jgi:cytochrome c
MSKSPNIFLPAIGITGLVLGAAYGISTRQYKADEAEVALRAAEAAQAQVAEQTAAAAELEAQLAELAARPSGGGATSQPVPVLEAALGLGRAAHQAELAAWDVDVLPDGRGLPEGSGNAFDGEEVYAEKCAACHGDFAEGVGNWPVLAGGFDTLADEDPVKTVGSYWPYLSTVWDYVHRSMPFGEAQTLSADETYAIVAYILYMNDKIDDDFELSRETFLEVEMYNAEGFVIDDRPALEYAAWSGEPCMTDCKDSVEVTMRATRLNVTPLDEHMHPAMRGEMPEADTAAPAATPAAAEEVSPETDEAALISAGEKLFSKCKSCHKVGPNARNGTGPHLNAVLGRTIGGLEGFRYSPAMASAGEEGRVWDEAELAGFLAAPKSYMKGTKMSFGGLKSDEDLAAMIAYLGALEE